MNKTELIAAIAEKTLMPESFVESADEKPLKRNIFQEFLPIFVNNASDQDKFIFDQQGKFIVAYCDILQQQRTGR